LSPVVRYLLSVCIPYALRVGSYSAVFTLRGISCPAIGRFVIGGAFLIVGLFPVPQILHILFMVGASWLLISRYTDTEFPDILFIALGVEVTSTLLAEEVIFPLIF